MSVRLDPRQKRHLKIIHLASIGVTIFFILRFNLTYHAHQYNAVLFTLLAAMLFAPLIYPLTRNYRLSAMGVFLFPVASAIYFIYAAGGIDAPGVFWLAVIPTVGGILLGSQGALWSGTFMFAAIGTYCGLGLLGITWPNIITDPDSYRSEKIINVPIFALFNLIITFYFIRAEEQAKGELSRQKRHTDALLRTILHDLSSPLMACQLAIDSISQTDAPEKKGRLLRVINDRIENLIQSLSKIRDITAATDGKTGLQLKTENVMALCQKSIEICKSKAESKHISFKLTGAIPAPTAYLDATLFTHVILVNLLSNAIKFSTPGGQIDISVKAVGSSVTLTIQDYGVGMPRNILENVFDMHLATSRSGTSGELGSGYGLFIVKRWIEELHGKLHIASREHNDASGPAGTTVEITLSQELRVASNHS
jgi:signal transduction histidine kinase